MITYYRTHLSGESRAKCADCGRTWAYWETTDDLAHHCHETDHLTHYDGNAHCPQCGLLIIPGDMFYTDDTDVCTYMACSRTCADALADELDYTPRTI